MSKWAIRLDGQMVWTCNGDEELFSTEKEAEQALVDYLNECDEAYKAGYMEDDGSDCDFRIVEVV